MMNSWYRHLYINPVVLSGYLGSESEANKSIRLAAHLSYALHNEAEKILEGKADCESEVIIDKIKAAQKLAGAEYADSFGALGIQDKS
jgi:hypothetical protein